MQFSAKDTSCTRLKNLLSGINLHNSAIFGERYVLYDAEKSSSGINLQIMQFAAKDTSCTRLKNLRSGINLHNSEIFGERYVLYDAEKR